VAASLLAEHGIAVFSEGQIDELIAWVEERRQKISPRKGDYAG
jgi:hypothetical protein